MLPPYAPEEVAAAVLRVLDAEGQRISRLTVSASDLAKEWCVEAVRDDGREIVARYPFSTREGINVPAEIAAWFLELLAHPDPSR